MFLIFSHLLYSFKGFLWEHINHPFQELLSAINRSASIDNKNISSVSNGINWINDDVITIDDTYSNSIKSSIDKIKAIDSDFVLRPTGYLVDLNHMWRSCKLMYSTAKSLNKHAIKIPNNLIQTESKIFKQNI